MLFRSLKRKIYDELVQWKEEDRRVALCLIGARQIGKTAIVKEFAKNHYEEVIELNFLENPDAKKLFDGSLRAEDILFKLSTFTRQELIEGKTLILFDEIQECPSARTAIKFFVEDGRYDYIETSSMLGVKIKEIKSYPVGFERIVNMYPLDFEEFLWANGIGAKVIDYLKQCFEEKTMVSESIHDTLKDLFHRYLIVGGMPEAVNTYLKTKNMQQVIKVQEELIDLYSNDIRKYAEESQRHAILEIFKAIPSQLDNQNRRFKLSQVMPKEKISRHENDFLWFTLAGIALPSYTLQEPQYPFQLNEKHNLFRLFLFDTDLLCAMSLDDIQFMILNGDLSINEGSILENYFAT